MGVLQSLGLSASFQAYSVTHGIVALFTIGVAAALVGVRRRLRDDPEAAGRFDRLLAGVAAVIFLLVIARAAWPGRFSWPRSLPLHVCDLVMISAIVAFAHGARWARTVLHFFGLLLTSQAYLTPDLTYGPATVPFYSSWSFHGAIVAAAAVDVLARGYRPAWGDWKIAVRVAVLYIAVIFPLDALFKWNYGYIGPADPSTAARLSTLGWFGPWPQRVPLFFVAFALLTAGMTFTWAVLPRLRLAVAMQPESELSADMPADDAAQRQAA